MSSLRRSTRLANKSKAVPAPVATNPTCNLTNAHMDGACYEQDKRPKIASRFKKFQDPIENVPLVVAVREYEDGFGDRQKIQLCFTRYCPSCQNYWKERLVA